MKVCGIELKSNEARLVILEGQLDDYNLVPTATHKFKIEESKDQQSVKDFQQKISSYLSSQDCTIVGIKERMTKGRFSGGAVSFKMEGLIQTGDYPVQLVHNMSIKAALKDVDFDSSSIKKYQEEAFKVALYLLKVHT